MSRRDHDAGGGYKDPTPELSRLTGIGRQFGDAERGEAELAFAARFKTDARLAPGEASNPDRIRRAEAYRLWALAEKGLPDDQPPLSVAMKPVVPKMALAKIELVKKRSRGHGLLEGAFDKKAYMRDYMAKKRASKSRTAPPGFEEVTISPRFQEAVDASEAREANAAPTVKGT